MTIEEKILYVLSKEQFASEKDGVSVWRLWATWPYDSCLWPRPKLSSLSSQLCKMRKAGKIETLGSSGSWKYRLFPPNE